MYSAVSAKAYFEDLRTLAFGGIGAAFAIVGTPFEFPCKKLTIWNTTNQNLYVSFNGVDTQYYIVAGTGDVQDIASNKSSNGYELVLPANVSGVWVRYETGAPASGNVHVACMTAITD